MNSIFSSFDAFSAELMGQKVRVSFAPPTSSSSSSSSATQKNNTTNNLQSQDSRKVNQNKKQEAKPSSTPSKRRFAPEFDGLNCFETLVSY